MYMYTHQCLYNTYIGKSTCPFAICVCCVPVCICV